MTRDDLVATAEKLTQPSPEAAEEFARARDKLVAKGNQIMAARSDLERLVGSGNQAMAEDNNANFARFMESMFGAYEPEVLVETVLWVFRAYRSHGFQLTYWPANLNTWVGMLREELSATTFEALYPFYDWMIVNIPAFVAISDQQFASDDG
jgi:hypothetical protein